MIPKGWKSAWLPAGEDVSATRFHSGPGMPQVERFVYKRRQGVEYRWVRSDRVPDRLKAGYKYVLLNHDKMPHREILWQAPNAPFGLFGLRAVQYRGLVLMAAKERAQRRWWGRIARIANRQDAKVEILR